MRKMSDIVRNQDPVTLPPGATVREACQCMRDRRVGAVLVAEADRRLLGIFRGSAPVHRVLAEGKVRSTASRPVKMPNRRRSASVTKTAPTRRSRMHWQASLTVAPGGSVTGCWFLTMSDTFLTIRPYAGGRRFSVRRISTLPYPMGSQVPSRGLSLLSRPEWHVFSNREYPRARRIVSWPLRSPTQRLAPIE